MISVSLDLKIEAYTDENTSIIIRRELEKDAQEFSQKCTDKARDIIMKRNKLKIYQHIAS